MLLVPPPRDYTTKLGVHVQRSPGSDEQFARYLESGEGESDLSFSSSNSDACTGSRFSVLCQSDDDDEGAASPVSVLSSGEWQVVGERERAARKARTKQPCDDIEVYFKELEERCSQRMKENDRSVYRWEAATGALQKDNTIGKVGRINLARAKLDRAQRDLTRAENQQADSVLTAAPCARHEEMKDAQRLSTAARGLREQTRQKLQKFRRKAGRNVGGEATPLVPKPPTAMVTKSEVTVTSSTGSTPVQTHNANEEILTQLQKDQPGLTLAEYAVIRKARVKDQKIKQSELAAFSALMAADESEDDVEPGEGRTMDPPS